MTEHEVQALMNSLPGQAIIVNGRFECKFCADSCREIRAFTDFTTDVSSCKTSNSHALADVKDLSTGKHMSGMLFLQKHDDLSSHSAMLYVKDSSALDCRWTSSFTVVSVEKGA